METVSKSQALKCATPLCVCKPVPGETMCIVCLMTEKKKRHKFAAKATIIDGHQFPSKAEARHYELLKVRLRAGEIDELELQPKIPLHAPKMLDDGSLLVLGHYIADFRYRIVATNERETVDVKSRPTRTAIYRWKKRHAEAEHGIKIKEVK